ncbi:MAG: hypothetical protein JNK05_13440 [Myxococcales bacterium]|nr:hypothetical protein [Myxococcales bacterium]
MPIPNESTRAIFQALTQCARNMRTIGYKTLAEQAKVPWSRKAVALHLGYIRDEICVKRGLPHLNQLAVNAKSKRPGDSVLPSKFKIPADAQERLWRGMVLQAMAYPWDSVSFDQA